MDVRGLSPRVRRLFHRRVRGIRAIRAGEYKPKLSEELGQRRVHHTAAAAVLLPDILHERRAGADGGDSVGDRPDEDVASEGVAAGDRVDFAGGGEAAVSNRVPRDAGGARGVVHHERQRGRDTGSAGADGQRRHGGHDFFYSVGACVGFAPAKSAVRRRHEMVRREPRRRRVHSAHRGDHRDDGPGERRRRRRAVRAALHLRAQRSGGSVFRQWHKRSGRAPGADVGRALTVGPSGRGSCVRLTV
mmetsp:Transcript_8313/g.36779  ORF Transcript_8313/g.36779 Transcript_8313/m.36779 type:complete len:246 (-) Transcript_8313:29-766(-)